MVPTWVDFYFLKTFKRHNTFAKICKSGVLKKVFRLRFRYAVTRGKGGDLNLRFSQLVAAASYFEADVRSAPTPSTSFIDLYRKQRLGEKGRSLPPGFVAQNAFGKENGGVPHFCRPADGGFHPFHVVGQVVEVVGECVLLVGFQTE